jgi:hypothetical protein
MSSIEVTIQPKEFITIRTSNKIAIFMTSVKLFQQAEIHVHFLDDSGNCIDVNEFVMEGDDYLSWSNDDHYVVNWVLTKLGLNIQQVIV